MGSAVTVMDADRTQAPRRSASGTSGSAPYVRRMVGRAKTGDRRALEELYLLHCERIYSYLHLSVGNRQDAEDLTVQTFVRMLETIDRFAWRRAPFSAWLFRIAHNLAIDHFRACRRGRPDDEPCTREATERSAEDEALRTIGRETMLTMIERLSPDQQQVLTLKFVFDFSNGEVATILGKSEGAVKSLQHRALAALERSLAR